MDRRSMSLTTEVITIAASTARGSGSASGASGNAKNELFKNSTNYPVITPKSNYFGNYPVITTLDFQLLGN